MFKNIRFVLMYHRHKLLDHSQYNDGNYSINKCIYFAETHTTSTAVIYTHYYPNLDQWRYVCVGYVNNQLKYRAVLS
jgi:hypothetical protein